MLVNELQYSKTVMIVIKTNFKIYWAMGMTLVSLSCHVHCEVEFCGMGITFALSKFALNMTLGSQSLQCMCIVHWCNWAWHP